MLGLSNLRLRTGLGAMFVGAIALSVVACGGDDPTPTRTPPTATAVPAPTETEGSGEVTSVIQSFTLENLTVKAGSTIIWRNLDGPTHTSTSGASPSPDGTWDTGVLGQNQAATGVTFNNAGTFAYFCQIHPGMQATVTVVS